MGEARLDEWDKVPVEVKWLGTGLAIWKSCAHA